METKEYRKNGISVLEIIDENVVVNGTQDLLDIISDFSIKRIILKRHNISEDFFDLHTGVAGEILQKASNYKIFIGIVGDFSDIESKSFRDFIFESNQTKQIVFKESTEEVLRIFCKK